jgi:hypothetical protein
MSREVIRMNEKRCDAWALLMVAAYLLPACAKKPAPPNEVVAVQAAALPASPADAAWKAAPAYTAALIVQDMVEPRLLAPSTPSVRVQALRAGARVAFRLSWTDSTQSDRPGPARFADACAVQLPASAGPNLPAPQMGEPEGLVEITYWSAVWQADVDGRGDSIQALYPNASVDHYPFEAASLERGSAPQLEMEKRYAPAQGAGHATHPEGRPVQDLVAAGPGTLTPAVATRSEGRGTWRRNTWEVVIVRDLPEALRGQRRTQVAAAVWDGARAEVGARKMRSVWIPLDLGGEP